jgi:hypothetical protein
VKNRLGPLFLAVLACLVLASCVQRGVGPSLSSPYVEPAVKAVDRPTAKQSADASLARALTSPPNPSGMRQAWFCPPDADTAKDDCYVSLVLTEILSDIGRRTRQGAGVLAIEVNPGPSLDQAPASCDLQIDLVSFKLVPKSIFTQGTLRPMMKSPCYSIGFQAKLSDCQCLGNIRDALAGLAGDARARGMVLVILDARRFGTWETGPADQEGVNVNAPGFDIVYAFIVKPKNFDSVASLDFVPADDAQGKPGIALGDAPSLSITLPDQSAPEAAAPAAATGKSAPKSSSKSGGKSKTKGKSSAKKAPAPKATPKTQ